MDVNKLVRFGFIFFLLLSIMTTGSLHLEARANLKNIIIISVDTLRAGHLGCYGYPLDTSPVIDAFSRDGIRFANCYSLTPLTSPSFSTMLTSLPPHKHGSKRNGLSIYRKIHTLPYVLKRFGYRSAAVISNWPLRKKLAGLHKDFSTYYEVFTKRRYMGILNSEGQAPAVNERAFDWLEKNSEKRFFLWVLFSEPHAPYIMHDQYAFDYSSVKSSTYPTGTRMKKIKRYDSEIAYTDYHIGRLLEKIKELGLYQDSLIIFLSDHGESFGEHNYFKHGRKLYNATLHVPLIVKLPGSLNKNTVRRENVCLLDIAPTILSVLNLPVFRSMEGIPLLGKDSKIPLHRKILLETYGGAVHFRRKDKKYHLKVKPIRFGLLDGPDKLIYNLKTKTFELYRLTGDPFESLNIFSRDYQGSADLKTLLLKESQTVNNYIKTSRSPRLNDASISKKDLDVLKSLGYIDD